jgi:tetratricopeptide (TPR) repeat protein
MSILQRTRTTGPILALTSLVVMVMAVLLTGCGGGGDTGSLVPAAENPMAAPEGWGDAERQAIALFADGRFDEAFAIHGQWVEKHPDFAEAHYSLADSHYVRSTQLRDGTSEELTERRHHLEQAAAHFRRYRELARTHDPLTRAQATGTLALVLSADGLNQLPEAEQVAREWTQEDPERAGAYEVLAQIQRDLGHPDAALETLRAAGRALRDDARPQYAALLAEHIDETRALTGEAVEPLLEEVHRIADARLQAEPKDVTALDAKILALRLQAERVETNPARRDALLAEAKRFDDELSRIIFRTP